VPEIHPKIATLESGTEKSGWNPAAFFISIHPAFQINPTARENLVISSEAEGPAVSSSRPATVQSKRKY
jgi:hypothetical protein